MICPKGGKRQTIDSVQHAGVYIYIYVEKGRERKGISDKVVVMYTKSFRHKSIREKDGTVCIVYINVRLK